MNRNNLELLTTYPDSPSSKVIAANLLMELAGRKNNEPPFPDEADASSDDPLWNKVLSHPHSIIRRIGVLALLINQQSNALSLLWERLGYETDGQVLPCLLRCIRGYVTRESDSAPLSSICENVRNLLSDNRAGVLCEACLTLVAVSPNDASRAGHRIVQFMTTEQLSRSEVIGCIYALGKIGQPLQHLRKLLESDDIQIRACAAMWLVKNKQRDVMDAKAVLEDIRARLPSIGDVKMNLQLVTFLRDAGMS